MQGARSLQPAEKINFRFCVNAGDEVAYDGSAACECHTHTHTRTTRLTNLDPTTHTCYSCIRPVSRRARSLNGDPALWPLPLGLRGSSLVRSVLQAQYELWRNDSVQQAVRTSLITALRCHSEVACMRLRSVSSA